MRDPHQSPFPSRGAESESPVLSFSQQRQWFVEKLDPGQGIHHLPARFHFQGHLVIPVLAASFDEIVRRHEVLRTAFCGTEAGVAPVIAPRLRPALPVVDLESLPARERDPEVRRLGEEHARRPFDLTTAPLLHLILLRLAADDHLLVVSLHRSIADDTSLGVLTQEIGTLYEAFLAARSSPLPEPALQYSDFAAWQREWMQGPALEEHLAYWRGQLAGLAPVLELPTDRPRPLRSSHRGGSLPIVVEEEAWASLSALARRTGSTRFMVLLALLDVLLQRYTGQDDIAVGSPVTGRHSGQTEELIGPFANTLVLRSDLSGNPRLSELLGRVRETVLAAEAYQALPFERLVDELVPERSLVYASLFQVMLALTPAFSGQIRLPGLTLERLPLDTGAVRFDLTVELGESGGQLAGAFGYDREIFDPPTVARMAENFLTLLRRAEAEAEQPLSEMTLLTAAEWRQLVVEWNQTAAGYPLGACVHQVFEKQADRYPAAPAVITAGERLTYRELEEQANRLANYLLALGVGLEMAVGLCIERSPQVVVAQLAILKAGGFYVPLDPLYPLERLAFLLQDTAASVIVTEEHLVSRLPETNARIVCIDRDWPLISQASDARPQVDVTPENRAYVMYTSGSTGRPKGVEALHRGVVRLNVEAGYARFGPGEVFLQHAPITFDSSTIEIYGALLNGSCVAVLGNSGTSLEDLAADIALCGVTMVCFTAGLFHQWVDSCLEGLRPMRQVIAGGDVVSPAHVRRLLAEYPDCQFYDGYGPTENTGFTTAHHVAGVDELTGAIPIGRPLGNTTVYVLDPAWQLVPVGAPGELCTGRDGLARGYLNRPELTADRFIPDPFGGCPGARLYRTGDLVCYRPDGILEFLGRRDNQFKIRGFRIEPGEIETALARCPGILDCAVVLRESARGDRRLVAYIVTGRPAPTSAGMAAFLRQSLPEYLIPSAFVPVPELPLNENGKVNRRFLAKHGPEPGWDTAQEEEDETAGPRSPIEELLAPLWADILELERVGSRQNFFALGGHSLLALGMISKLQRLFGIDLPLQTLFQSPVLSAFAARVEATLPVVDLESLPLRERETETSRLEEEQAWRPFDLTVTAPQRLILVRMATGVHRLSALGSRRAASYAADSAAHPDRSAPAYVP